MRDPRATIRRMSVTVEQMIATLRQRAAERQARDAARGAELRRQLDAPAAAEELRGVELWLIGSLAWGGFGVRSDIDVVVGGLPPERVGPLETAWTLALRVPVELLRYDSLGALLPGARGARGGSAPRSLGCRGESDSRAWMPSSASISRRCRAEVQMQLDIAGLRSRVIAAELLPELHELRRFRHFFRQAYLVDLDPQQVRARAQALVEMHDRLAQGFEAFRAGLHCAIELPPTEAS